jgi:hypothetical protein
MAGYKGSTFDNDLLKLIFNAVAIANLADNAASSPITNLYVALHTADPTAAGNQSSNECAYTGYARVAVARTSGGWVIASNSVSPVANITFGTCTASAGSPATHASVGTTISGATKLLYGGALSSPITITVGQAPVIASGSTITES